MSVILNILPNVYWMYNNSNKIISRHDYNIELQKYSELFNINTLMDLDDKLEFWQKSKQYINEIKNEMEKAEFSKLLLILKQSIEIISTAYLSNTPVLISTYSQQYIEIGLAIWIYFFHVNANMAFGDIIKLLAYKIIGNISMSNELKKFFALLNIGHKNN